MYIRVSPRSFTVAGRAACGQYNGALFCQAVESNQGEASLCPGSDCQEEKAIGKSYKGQRGVLGGGGGGSFLRIKVFIIATDLIKT